MNADMCKISHWSYLFFTAFLWQGMMYRVFTQAADTYSVTVAVFAPLNCTQADIETLCIESTQFVQNTMEISESEVRADWFGKYGGGSHTFNLQMFNVCTNVDAMKTLMEAFMDSTITAIVGPASHVFCEPAGTLAEEYNKALVSWNCINDVMSDRQSYPTFIRTVPSSGQTARVLAMIFKHFRWKRVAILYTREHPWYELSHSIHKELTASDFDVENFIEFDRILDLNSTLSEMKVIAPNTKGIILCMNTGNLPVVLQSAYELSLTNGQHAFFLVQTHHQLDHIVLNNLIDEMNDTSPDTLFALDALFLLVSESSHPTSGQSSNSTSREEPSAVNIPLYNAITVLAKAIEETISSELNPSDGKAVAMAIRNTSVQGAGDEPIRIDNNGDVAYYFYLMDYNSRQNRFVSVLEMSDKETLAETDVPIIWPNGQMLKADICDFTVCASEGFNSVLIIVIIIILCLLVAGVIGLVTFVRKRLANKELEKGPNKILLTGEDLVFVSAKERHKMSKSKQFASTKSASLFNKPDLLKASEPSLSASSFSSFEDFSETARYNGDVVFVKELHIKGFEMKSKVRQYLKQMRDLRHENINPFIGCYTDPLRPALIMEHCTRKSLEDVINNDTLKLDWDFKLSLMTDLVRGMRYLHSSPIKQHGNLKSGNLVIDSRWVLKITDYGLFSMLEKYQTKRQPKPKDLLWTAPEHLREPETCSQKGDVYSFAIIMQEIIMRGHPFCMLELDPEEIIRKIRKPPPLCRPSVSQQAAPPSYIQIMKQCWAEMPDMRPDFETIYQQFKDFNKGKKMNIVDTMFKMLEKYSNDLEETVAIRTMALDDEKKKTENLLAQMLPVSVAHSLLTGKPVDPETYQEVTIYFSDIVGFTTISAMSTPLQVVDLLNDLYTMFDNCMDSYDVYKVETIGDAYMCVSGLPNRNGNKHAGEIASMALDLLSQCGQFTIRHMPEVPMRLRIGLHSGPCVAGVVGLRMPRYCLFGDTVNTASRMESTGCAFRIHVSPSTKDILDELTGYKLEFRGEVELKGKGLAKTYWLVGKEGFDKPLPAPPAQGLGSLMKNVVANKVLKSKTSTATLNKDGSKRSMTSVQEEGSQPLAREGSKLSQISTKSNVEDSFNREARLSQKSTRSMSEMGSSATSNPSNKPPQTNSDDFTDLASIEDGHSKNSSVDSGTGSSISQSQHDPTQPGAANHKPPPTNHVNQTKNTNLKSSAGDSDSGNQKKLQHNDGPSLNKDSQRKSAGSTSVNAIELTPVDDSNV